MSGQEVPRSHGGGVDTTPLPIRPIRIAALAAILVASASVANGQVSPSQVHATIGAGAGLSPSVSPTGGYAAQVPLDLPSPRGPLPIPLSIVYTGLTRAGAAGAGWDIPISYVAWQSQRRNRPGIDSPDWAPPPRLMLALDGAPQRMVQADSGGSLFVPYLALSYEELRKVGDEWHLKTLNNLEYVFRRDQRAPTQDRWLLEDINDLVGTDRVHIEYSTGAGLGQCAEDLHVTRISYGYSKNAAPLYQVELTYDGWWRDDTAGGGGVLCASDAANREARVIDRSVDDNLPTDRSTIVTAVTVKARNNLDGNSSLRPIRSYDLGYQPDLDSGKPRLASVTMHGEAGQGSVPIATYAYGALQGTDGPIRYGVEVDVPRSPHLPAEYLDDVAADTKSTYSEYVEPLVPEFDPADWPRLHTDYTASRHVIRDFTGDGVPDELWKDGATWHLAPGVVRAGKVRLDGWESTWTQPAELFEREPSTTPG